MPAENLTEFKWNDVPAIRARVNAKYGKTPFQITLKLLFRKKRALVIMACNLPLQLPEPPTASYTLADIEVALSPGFHFR
jgi:ribosomal protein L30E